jgi:hypothetical protein
MLMEEEYRWLGSVQIRNNVQDFNIRVKGIVLIYVNKQTGTIIFHIRLFLFSTCFGHPCAHHQEN